MLISTSLYTVATSIYILATLLVTEYHVTKVRTFDDKFLRTNPETASLLRLFLYILFGMVSCKLLYTIKLSVLLSIYV